MNRRRFVKYAGPALILTIFLFPALCQVLATPALGQRSAIILLVEFPDVKHSIGITGVQNVAEGLANFYKDQSYGKLQLKIDIDQNWHTASNPASYYHLDDFTFPSGEMYRSQLIRETASLASSNFDISKYSFLLVFHAGRSGSSWAFSPDWGSGQYLCSISDQFFCQTRVTLDREYDVGTAFHEFGHLLNLPDLYDYELLTRGRDANIYVGSWDLMGGENLEPSPMGMSAWSRMKLGWISDNQITTVARAQKLNVTLTPLELGNGTLAIKIPLDQSSTKYYLIEVRYPVGYDRNLPGAGVLVYLANDALGSGLGPLRLVNMKAFTLVYDPTSDSNLGYVDESNNIAIVLLSMTSSSYQIEITTASMGRILIQRVYASLNSSYIAASESIKQADDAIARAILENRFNGIDEANQLISKARLALSSGDYASAASLAQQAIKAADAAKVTTTQTTSPTIESTSSMFMTPHPLILQTGLSITYVLGAIGVIMVVAVPVIVLVRRRRARSG